MDIRPWRTTASHRVVDDRWLRLRADDCVCDDGTVVSPYYVLEQADWVTVVALTDDGDVVLVEEYHHGAGIVAAGLPGGGVEPGEDPVAAGVRELGEETGFAPARAASIDWCWANWGNQTNRVHVVVAEGCAPMGAAEEGARVLLRPLGEVLADPPQQAYHQAALAAYGRWCGAGTVGVGAVSRP